MRGGIGDDRLIGPVADAGGKLEGEAGTDTFALRLLGARTPVSYGFALTSTGMTLSAAGRAGDRRP